MRAIRFSFFQMVRTMRRDMMLFVSCFVPIFAGLFFRFAIPFLEDVFLIRFHMAAVIFPYYRLIDVFCFVSAMISLEEADEKTAAYLFITPLGKTGYLSARLGVPAVTAFLITVFLLPVFRLTDLSLIAILLFAAGGTMQGMIEALLIVTISSNKLEGMAVAKLSMLPVVGAVIPFFIRENIQYVLSWLPSFWIGKAAHENRVVYMLPAFALSAVWIGFLFKRYLRKM